MKHAHPELIERFHRVLVEEIHQGAPQYLTRAFTVAEIYQSLIPYRTHRDRLGVEINGDYEDALLRLLAGEGDFVILESEPARNRIRKELGHPNPNTGIYREFAAVGVRLNPVRLPAGSTRPAGTGNGTPASSEEARAGGEEPRAGRTGDAQDELPLGSGEGRSASPKGRHEPRDDEPAGTGRAAPSKPPALRRPEEASAMRTQAGTDAPTGSDLAQCPECDAELPDRASLRFCPRCGANVLLAPCRYCGEVLERAWQFCVACGKSARD